jgi:hypothetical protein
LHPDHAAGAGWHGDKLVLSCWWFGTLDKRGAGRFSKLVKRIVNNPVERVGNILQKSSSQVTKEHQ